jgi:hypothetical protein
LYFILLSPQPRGKQPTQAARRSVNRGVEVRICLTCSNLSERSDIRTDVAIRGNALVGALEPRDGDDHATRTIAEPAKRKTQSPFGIAPKNVGKIRIPNSQLYLHHFPPIISPTETLFPFDVNEKEIIIDTSLDYYEVTFVVG